MSNTEQFKLTLDTPVDAGGKKETKFTLTEPKAGQLRGLKMVDILQGDVAALITLLPRITSPALTENEVAALRPKQVGQFYGGVMSFFSDEVAEELANQSQG